jgi:hypothetical protein
MVAGLSRNSHHASHHSMPTLHTNQPWNCHQATEQSLILRPKNPPERTTGITASVTSTWNLGMAKNVNKRLSSMSIPDEEEMLSIDRLAITEAKRRYVLRPQLGYSLNSMNSMMMPSSDDSFSSSDEQVVAGILDGITSLCLGPTSQPRGYNAGVSSSRRVSGRLSPPPQHRRRKQVVYPIASYPARLNCKRLVSERRAIFQQNLFRPVSSDEMSYSQTIRA